MFLHVNVSGAELLDSYRTLFPVWLLREATLDFYVIGTVL